MLITEARQAAANGSARKARQDARLTQREVAGVCGVSPATVSMWETGHRVPRGKAALAYGRLLRALSERPGTALAGLNAALWCLTPWEPAGAVNVGRSVD